MINHSLFQGDVMGIMIPALDPFSTIVGGVIGAGVTIGVQKGYNAIFGESKFQPQHIKTEASNDVQQLKINRLNKEYELKVIDTMLEDVGNHGKRRNTIQLSDEELEDYKLYVKMAKDDERKKLEKKAA
jgi:hypothetical protein